MPRHAWPTDRQWDRSRPLPPSSTGRRGRSWADHRRTKFDPVDLQEPQCDRAVPRRHGRPDRRGGQRAAAGPGVRAGV